MKRGGRVGLLPLAHSSLRTLSLPSPSLTQTLSTTMALRRAASSLGLSMRAPPASGAMTRGSADAFRGALTRWMSTCE